MLVWKSTFESMMEKAEQEKNSLIQDYNQLVERFNNLAMRYRSSQKRVTVLEDNKFTPDEISALIRWSHPDRHANSEVATSVTQKLLRLRG